MIITYQGDNYFKLQASNFTVLVDPHNQRSFKGADLIINTLKPGVISFSENPDHIFLIDHQGEFEIKGVQIRGWSLGYEKEKEKTVYRLIMDNLIIGILGSLSKPLPENIEDYFIGADIILGSAVKKLKPAIVILGDKGKVLEQCLQEFNQKDYEIMEKLVVKKKDISFDKTKIICLKS